MNRTVSAVVQEKPIGDQYNMRSGGPASPLVETIYALLPPINDVLAEHGKNSGRECIRCASPWPRGQMEVAIKALDLVVATRRGRSMRELNRTHGSNNALEALHRGNLQFGGLAD